MGIKLNRGDNSTWEANENILVERMNPLNDCSEFDDSFMSLLRPAMRKSRRQRKNIPDEVPIPPPSSSSDEDLFLRTHQKPKKKRRK